MDTIETNSAKAWMLATRPKTLAAAVAPVILGTAIGFQQEGTIKIIPAVICLLFAVLMQAAANLINDLIDYQKGSDGEERLGPMRATAQGWITPLAMKIGIATFIGTACLIGLGILYYTSWHIIGVGILCAIFAYFYTSGPFPLSYNGLGDVAVIAFFGVVATGFSSYVQCGKWNIETTLMGIAMGIVVNALLVVNNYRDRDNDARCGKRTLIVLLGEPFGRYFYLANGLIATAFVDFWFAFENNKIGILLMIIYIVRHLIVWKKLCIIREGKALNKLIGQTSLNMLIFALLTTLGICLSE